MIILDYKDTRPIYEQITDKLQKLILSGVLEPDSKMPSVRSLAMELSINPNTVQRAYEELERKGFIYTVKGRGNFVSYNESLSSIKRQEIVTEMRKLLKEAGEIGIPREELIEELRKELTND